jgi:TonB-linked SusC/RagA family outer membrane protein
MQLKLTFYLAFAFFICCVGEAYSQSTRVKGKVMENSTGIALPGASVKIKGTNIGTVTDVSGNYSLSIPQSDATIVVSFIGFTTIEKKVEPNGEMNFQMVETTSQSLAEVVVIGYGTQKTEKVTGAISTIKSADIEKSSAVRIEDAIQGKVSGVTIIQNGSPGTNPTVLIRGVPSYTGSDPLVVVDGVEQTLTDFNSLNPIDVESVSILKDAAATAIYGVKGGNGVILVTTKTGRKNQNTQFRLSSSYGVQQVLSKVDVLNASQYAAILNEGSALSGGNVIFPNLTTLGVGTNWQDQIFKNAPLQNYALSATGGSDKTTYFLEVGATNQAGIVGGASKSDYGRYNFTANLNFDLTPKLKFILNATDVVLNSKGIAENSFNSIIGEALNFDPTVPVYNNVPNTIGQYGFSTLELQEIHNPLTTLANTYNKDLGNKLYGKFEFQYDVIKNLKLTARFGYTKYDDNAKSFNPLVFYGLQNSDNTLNADGSTVDGKHNSVSSAKNSNFNWTSETYANYDFKIKNDHHFQAVLGLSLAESSGNSAGASRQDVPFNSYTYADFTAATGVNTATNINALSGYYYQYSDKKLSYFSRLSYDYKEKYLATASYRIDGDQVFGANNKFGNFYAGSLGWIISKEDFFHSDLVDFLKLRGSYGVSGNSNASNVQTTSIVTGGAYNNIGNSNGYSFNGVFYPGSSIGSLANPNLAWERDKQADIGVDVEIGHKFSLTADVYRKIVSGLLFTPSQSLYLGTVPASNANIGTTSTKGIDAMISYNNMVSKDFKINTSLTFSTFSSLVTSTNSDNSAIVQGGYFFNGQSQPTTVFKKGYAPGTFWGYKTDGLFQNQAQIIASPTQAGAQPGDIKYKDINGDGVINSADQTSLGNAFPKFTIGWNLNLNYKQFDFTAFIYVSQGNKIFKVWDRNANFTNKPSTVLGRWTGPGTTNNAEYPLYTFSDNNDNARVSDRYIEDGSFVKIKNLQLGYTIPKSILKGENTSFRIYAQVKNAYTFTKYTGFDPEISGGLLNSGVDYGNYPQPRTFLLGLDFKF